MNGKLLILLVAGMLMGNAAVFAQKKSKDPFAKEIAAEQKRLESEGWKVWNSTEVLQQLLRQKYVMQNELMVTADGEKKNRYIVSKATAQNRSLNTAISLAETKAKSDIASKQKAVVDVTTVQLNSTKNTDGNVVESADRTGTSISKHSNVRMNKVERVLTLYRETAQGQYCVEVCMALDLKN